MSEVKLVIRDANEDRSGTVHGSVADCFIAALSADPVSITELDAAVDRFALESPVRGHFRHFRHRLDTEPWDAGLVVIDLAARLVVIDSTYSTPGLRGVVTRHNVDGVQGKTVLLRYQLADAWMFLYDAMNWEERPASGCSSESTSQKSTCMKFSTASRCCGSLSTVVGNSLLTETKSPNEFTLNGLNADVTGTCDKPRNLSQIPSR